MKKISLPVLVSLFFYLVFSLACAQTTSKEEATKEETTKEDTTKVPAPPKVKYVGSLVCKPCHNLKSKGKIYDKWAASKHAVAYEMLANEESQKIAKEMKIKDPQKSDKCLKCHATGYDATDKEKGPKFNLTEGISCEGCHGAGEKYKSMKVMKNPELSKENGLIMPGEKECKGCHNEESPTYKKFKFAEAWKVIDHSVPKKTE